MLEIVLTIEGIVWTVIIYDSIGLFRSNVPEPQFSFLKYEGNNREHCDEGIEILDAEIPIKCAGVWETACRFVSLASKVS